MSRSVRRIYNFRCEEFLGYTPPLIISILIAVLLDGKSHSVQEIMFSMTLLNYFFSPQNVVQGVAWTLVIEMLFYILILVTFPFVKKKPILAVIFEVLIIYLVIFFAREFGANFFSFICLSCIFTVFNIWPTFLFFLVT